MAQPAKTALRLKVSDRSAAVHHESAAAAVPRNTGAAFRIPGLRIVTVWAVMSAPLRPDNHTNTGTIYKAVLLHRGSQSDGFAIHALHDPVLQMPLHH